MLIKSFRVEKLLISYCLIISVLGTVNGQSRAKIPAHKFPIVVIAHRGDHTQVPENTIVSIQHAISVGADYVEVDLRTTKDGRLVIMHDQTVDRMTSGTGKVKDLTFEYIRSLKVSDKSKPGSPSFRVPTFEEVLKACKGKINIYLDFKDADVKTVYSMLKSSGMDKHVAVYLNAESHYTDWQKTASGIPLMSGVPGDKKDAAQVKEYLDKFNVSIVDGSPGEYRLGK